MSLRNNNAVPRQYLSTSPVRDTTAINFLTANVANPFAGLLPGEGLNGSTTQRQQLLRPYPQFGNIDTRRYDGSSSFDSAQFRLERRFRGGYTVLGAYTWSDFKEKVTRLNDTDADYEERLNDTQLPHRFVLNGTKTVDVEDPKLAAGPFALQWGRGTIKFRKVEIKPL